MEGFSSKAGYVGFDHPGRDSTLPERWVRDTRLNLEGEQKSFKDEIEWDIEKLRRFGRGYIIVLGHYGDEDTWGDLEHLDEWDDYREHLVKMAQENSQIEFFWNDRFI